MPKTLLAAAAQGAEEVGAAEQERRAGGFRRDLEVEDGIAGRVDGRGE